MYPNPPNTSSSDHHHPAAATDNHQQHHQLTRYSSAPSSFFDSLDVLGGGGGISSNLTMGVAGGAAPPLQPPASCLARQSSSPAGFLQHLTSDTGFTLTSGGGSYKNPQATSSHGHNLSSRRRSQLSFKNQDTTAHVQTSSDVSLKRASTNFSFGAWEDGNSIAFASSSGNRARNVNDDDFFTTMESQMELSEMQIPEDSVAWKVRAKRGFATHPRSIAERERRTKISVKLKKLQELVPNMDKQTSYSEMLDLAVEHIKGLQSHIQKLNKELDSCTCGCRHNP